MSQFEFDPLAPHRSQLVDRFIGRLDGLLEYEFGLVQLTVLLVELGEFHPELVVLAVRLLGVNCLNRLCECVYDLDIKIESTLTNERLLFFIIR